MTEHKRYVQVGLGSRSYLYHEAMLGPYADRAEMAGVCDLNEGRVRTRLDWADQRGGEARGYLAGDFDRMLAECRPDTVIVTTMDSTHDDYICRAMEAGCDVISEKPMTTTAEKCRRILDAQRRTGRSLRVTFNYRYSPPRTQVKSLLMSGVIGEVLSVDFHWLLDTSHGADYFRRWHRVRANSGSLLVHKATHHFDMVNWWLDSSPETVYATGQLRFYTPAQGDAYGLHARGERCLGCPEAARCAFYLDIRQYAELRALYLENEQYDGYFRDRCVFSGQIDIWDSMGLQVQYANGAVMTYSLNAFMPWEGYTIAFNGRKGRLEHHCEETVYISGDGSVPGALKAKGTTIHIYPHFAPAYEVPVWQAEGGHGGGDDLMLKDIFNPGDSLDPYGRAADQRAGAYSILTGIAAYHSIDSGLPVRIQDLEAGV
jgi:predicted dehydrogenase